MKTIRGEHSHCMAGRFLRDTAIIVALMYAGSVHAQIPVEAGGVAPLPFMTTPLANEFATGVLNGGAPTYSSTGSMDAGAQTVNVVRRLPTDGNIPPLSFSGGFRHNTTAFYLQSRPTTDNTNAASILVARLQNMTGANVIAFTVTYDFGINNPGTGEVPGFRVFYSATGTQGSWQLIPSLSSTEVAGTHTANISSVSWTPGALFYFLRADDNANSITDPSYTIDNFSITSVLVAAVGPTCVAIRINPPA